MGIRREDVFVGLVGVSGVGKSTIAACLAEDYDFSLLPSYTTRDPREGDAPGELRHVTDSVFHDFHKRGRFLETAFHGGRRYALAKPDGPGPYVSPVNAEGIAYLIEHAMESGLYIMPIGLLPPCRETWNARNSHLGREAWLKRAARDEHFGIRVPPPLTLGIYEATLVNRLVRHTAYIITQVLKARLTWS